MARSIKFNIDLDTGNSNRSLEILNASLEELNKNAEENADAINDIEDAIDNLGKTGKKSTKELSGGFKKVGVSIGGLIKSLGIITLIVKAFEQLKAALERNQKAADFLAKSTVALEIIFDKLIQNAIIPMAEWLYKAFTEPQQALEDLKNSLIPVKEFLMELSNFIGSQFLEVWKRLVKSILEARIKWNEWTGDAEEAQKLKDEVTAIDEELKKLNEQQDAFKEKVVDGFKSAVEGAKEFITETINAADEQVKLNRLAELADVRRQKSQLEFQKLAEEQRQIRDDESKSFEDRIAANTELGLILNQQAEAEKVFANQKLAAAQAEVNRNQGNIAAQRDLIAAQTELADIEERIVGQRSEQLVNEVSLRREVVGKVFDQINAETELANTAEQVESKRLENLIMSGQEKLIILQEQGLMESELYSTQLNEQALLEEQLTQKLKEEEDKRVENNKKANEEKKKQDSATAQAALGAAAGLTGAIGSLINTRYDNEIAAAEGNEKKQEKIRKKQFEANKALQLVQAVIATAQAVINGFNAGASLGPAGVVMGPVMAALAGVTGAIQIAAIASSKYTPTGGGGGSAPRTPSASAGTEALSNATSAVNSIEPPTFGINSGAAGGASNIAGQGVGEGGSTPPPQQVFVLETDITDVQNNVAVVEDRAEIG